MLFYLPVARSGDGKGSVGPPAEEVCAPLCEGHCVDRAAVVQQDPALRAVLHVVDDNLVIGAPGGQERARRGHAAHGAGVRVGCKALD